jgi:hypothetical protein
MEFEAIWSIVVAFVLSLWEMPEVKVIVYHSLVNFVAGVAAAMATGTFDLSKVVEFFSRKIVPYVMLYAAALVGGEAVLGGVLSAAVFIAIEAALVKDLVDSLSRIPGLSGVIDKLPAPVFKALTK